MNTTTAEATAQAPTLPEPFNLRYLRQRPLSGTGRGLLLLLRVLFGVFFLSAAFNKFQQNYLFSEYPLKVFTQRLTEIDPNSFGAWNLQNFIIPNYQLIGWIVAWGELAAAVGLLLGLCTRTAALIAIFLMVNFALGGYYDASLIVLNLMALPFVLLPTGHWWGLDRRLHQRYPRSIWFR